MVAEVKSSRAAAPDRRQRRGPEGAAKGPPPGQNGKAAKELRL